MSEPNYKGICLNHARVIESFSESLDARNKEIKELRALFKRYIDHVGEMEGITFVKDIECDEDRAKVEAIDEEEV